MKSFTGACALAASTALLAIGCGSDPGASNLETDTEEPSVLFDSIGRELGPVSSAIVRANREAERTMNLVARIEVRRNELVEFYEPTPGTVLIMVAGAPDAHSGPAPQYTGDTASLWRALTLDAQMPALLADAVARVPARAQRPERPAAPPSFVPPVQVPRDPAEPPASGIGEAAHQTNDWCDSSYYTVPIAGYGGALGMCTNFSYWEFSTCWDHVTGFGASWHEDAADFKGNVCPMRGNVIYKLNADEDWISEGQWTVLQNSYRGKVARDSGCAFDVLNDCPTIRTDVLNADGDRYQYRFLAAPE